MIIAVEHALSEVGFIVSPKSMLEFTTHVLFQGNGLGFLSMNHRFSAFRVQLLAVFGNAAVTTVLSFGEDR